MAGFDGRVALVSGAASGIGLAVVERLTAEGATVVGCDIQPLAEGIRCDVRDEESCAAAVATVLERHGHLDVLANVAGIGIARTLATLAADEWRNVIDVN